MSVSEPDGTAYGVRLPREVPMSVYEMVGWIAAALAALIVSAILLGIWSVPK